MLSEQVIRLDIEIRVLARKVKSPIRLNGYGKVGKIIAADFNGSITRSLIVVAVLHLNGKSSQSNIFGNRPFGVGFTEARRCYFGLKRSDSIGVFHCELETVRPKRDAGVRIRQGAYFRLWPG